MTERTKRMLAELDPKAQSVFEEFLKRLDEALGDDQYIVFEGRRTVETQRAYYAQGRQPLAEVNRLRQIAGLWLLRSENDNRNCITWTMNSKHIVGLAMDVLPVDGRGNPTWDLAHYKQQFDIIVACGRSEGLNCGADWVKTPDYPHYEIKE